MGRFTLQHLGPHDEVLGEKKVGEEDIVAEMYGFIDAPYEKLVAYILAEGPDGFRAIRRNPCYAGVG